MKVIVQRQAILLAALLQLLPLVRNFFINPATASAFAFVLRWGAGTTAALGAVDAVSGATNRFTSPSTFTGTVGVPFTNNLTVLISKGDGGGLAIITSNSVSVVLSQNGQSTNFAMPPGLALKFLNDIHLASPVYDAVYGVPTAPGTNAFIISMEYGSSVVSADITIKILPGTRTLPTITTTPRTATGGVFQFTFNPVIGLTNTVQRRSTLTGGLWETLTNIAPPATTNSITVADPFTSSNRFYRVQIIQ